MDPLPVHCLYGWIRFRLINQPIVAPAAMPAARVIPTVSNGCRSKRLFVL